jgi:hypothetical protein
MPPADPPSSSAGLGGSGGNGTAEDPPRTWRQCKKQLHEVLRLLEGKEFFTLSKALTDHSCDGHFAAPGLEPLRATYAAAPPRMDDPERWSLYLAQHVPAMHASAVELLPRYSRLLSYDLPAAARVIPRPRMWFVPLTGATRE